MEPKRCIQCGNIIIGRSDKKFCDSQCRYLHHVSRRQLAEAPILQTNSALRKNRSILKTLCPKGKATVRKEVLVSMGYDFNTFSSAFATSRGVYYICYDYAFSPVLDGLVEKALIVTAQDYMLGLDPWKYIRQNIPDEDLKHFL